MRVLLVEDDLVAARGIAMMLKSGGAIVDTTDTGEEALELTRHYDYDIVILDLMLPTWRVTRSSGGCGLPGRKRRS